MLYIGSPTQRIFCRAEREILLLSQAVNLLVGAQHKILLLSIDCVLCLFAVALYPFNFGGHGTTLGPTAYICILYVKKCAQKGQRKGSKKNMYLPKKKKH